MQDERTIADKLHVILGEVHDENLIASPEKMAALGSTALTLLFEWGSGNEALIAVLGGHVLKQTHDLVQTAATAGAVSFGEQTIFGLAATLAVASVPRVMSAVREQFLTKAAADAGNEGDQSLRDRVLGAFALGTSLTTIMRNAVEQHSIAENAKIVLADAGIIALGNIAIGATVTELVNIGIATGHEALANGAVNVISSPLTWIGLFIVSKFGLPIVRKGWAQVSHYIQSRDDLSNGNEPTDT